MSVEYLILTSLVERPLVDSVDDLGLLIGESLTDRTHKGKLMDWNRNGFLLAALLAALWEANTERGLEAHSKHGTHSCLFLNQICLNLKLK